MILGINPSGSADDASTNHHTRPFDDAHYCGYLDDLDGAPAGSSPFQKTVQRIVQTLTGFPPSELGKVLRGAQSGNVIPFRSPTSAALTADLKKTGRAIGRDLILAARPTPRVIVTLAHEAWDVVIEAAEYPSKFKGKETLIHEGMNRSLREAEMTRGPLTGAYLLGLPAVVRDKMREDVAKPLHLELAKRRELVLSRVKT